MTLEFYKVLLPMGNGQTLSGLSFVAEGGRLTCVTGQGGLSVVRAAMGLLPIAEGNISYDGALLSKESARALRRFTAYVPPRLVAAGKAGVYEPPTPADVLALKANRGPRGAETVFDVAEMLDRPVLLVADETATAEWLRQQADRGRTVVVASNLDSIVDSADNVVRT